MSECRGWLTKQAGATLSLQSSKRRWFVLTSGGVLFYYKTELSTKAQGSVDLPDILEVVAIDSLSFTIVTPSRTFFLTADSEPERSRWLAVLPCVRPMAPSVSPSRPNRPDQSPVPRLQRSAPNLPIAKGKIFRKSGGNGDAGPSSPRSGGAGVYAPATSLSPRSVVKGLLDGEQVMSETPYVVLMRPDGETLSRGTLYTSNFRILYQGDLGSSGPRTLSLPYGMIRQMQEQTMLSKLRNTSADHLVLTFVTSRIETVAFGFSKKTNNSLSQFKAAVQSFVPTEERGAFAFAHCQEPEEWIAPYNVEAEFERLAWGESFRLTSVNRDFGVCSSYPSSWVVPANVTDEELREASSFRGHSRVVACIWIDPNSRAPLARCSQPAVGISNNRSASDERIIAALLEAAGTGDACEMQLFDARPKKNALANKAAKGAGYENIQHLKYCSLTFLNVENIHVMRSCWLALVKSCADGLDDAAFYSNSAAWLGHISLLLAGGVKISNKLAEGQSCVVHCSDGWDRTPQLCCLTMLMGDPHYRTLLGFASMIESQWVLFGHQFALRQNWFSLAPTDQMSPIFLMFIDCVFQILRQHRNAFEFTEQFLIDLCDNLDSLQYGTFLAHEKGRRDLHLTQSTRSMWDVMLRDPENVYCNSNYLLVPTRVLPSTTQRAVVLWRDFYLRHSQDR